MHTGKPSSTGDQRALRGQARRFLGLVSCAVFLASFSPSPAVAVKWHQRGMVTVAAGRWGKTVWALGASESDGTYCVNLAINGNTHISARCRVPNGTPFIHLVEQSGPNDPRPALFGFTVSASSHAQVTSVVATLSSGQHADATVAVAPRGLPSRSTFFVVPVPCNTYPTSVIGTGAAGVTLTEWPTTMAPVRDPWLVRC